MKERDEKNVLLIENNAKNIQFVAASLMPEGYTLSFAMNGEDGLTQIKEQHFDMILIDVDIPKVTAFEVVKELQTIQQNCDTPVIFLINEVSTQIIEELFAAGVVDYVSKPFVEQELLVRVKTHLHRDVHSEIFSYNIQNRMSEKVDTQIKHRFDEMIEQNKIVSSSQQEIIFTLCSLTEKRSNEKEIHVRRVADVSYLLALLVGFNDEEANLLKMASPMHDIGNLAIPDAILDKPDKLSMQEFEQVEQHTKLGYDMLKHSSDPILKVAATIALQHHEKYNGSGYPSGLKGDEIHIFARIVALADVFDTLSDDRVYGKAWTDEDIERYIEGERGQHFDPTLVDLFFKHKERFFALRSKNTLF